jgi:hypothetical protein
MPITINGSTGIAGVDGSASTPAIQGTDTNTGVTFPAADTVAVSTGGSERMRITTAGDVGIGTSAPSYKLEVNGTFGANYISLISNASAPSVDAAIFRPANGTLAFVSNASERGRIDSNGVWLFRTTSTSKTAQGIHIAQGTIDYIRNPGNEAATFYNASSGAAVGQIVVNTASTSYNTTSDYRLKENVQPMQNALATVAQLNPVNYTWKADGSAGQGFIAHELQAVVPDCVTGEKDAVDDDGNPRYQGVDTSFLVATLTKAIQELNAKVEGLQAEINALKGAA